MKVLVTGHKGFVGKQLIKQLDDYIGMDLEKDITQEQYFHDIPKTDLVIHLASNCSNPKSIKNPVMDARISIIGTLNVLEYCRKHNVPILFFSTCRVYRDDDGSRPPYGLSKNTAEEYIKIYHKLYNIPYIILRPSTIYGTNQNGTVDAGWVYHFINSSINNKTITIFGDGNQTRDVLYIDDLIELIIHIIVSWSKFENKTFDVGGGQSNVLSLNTLASYLELKVKYKPRREIDFIHYVSDMDRLFKITDWKPRTNWIDGVNKIIGDIKNEK